MNVERLTVGKWKFALLDADLALREKYVALVLAVHMDRAGETYVSLDTLARESGQSKHTVKKYVDQLASKGWVIRYKLGNGRAAHTFASSPTGAPQDSTAPPVHSGSQPVQKQGGTGAPQDSTRTPELQRTPEGELRKTIPSHEEFEEINRLLREGV